MSRRIQRVYWQHRFRQSDAFYLLDGARVVYDANSGVLYEHHMFRQGMPILELSSELFLGLPVNEIVKFSLESEDSGILPFLEIRFFKAWEEIASFSEINQKSVEFVVPEYDSFLVRLRASGAGMTRLFSITGRVMSTGSLIFEGDRKLSENVGVQKIEGDGSEDTLLVTFSEKGSYLTGAFFSDIKPQYHFASLDGRYDVNEVLDFILMSPYHKMKVYGATEEILSNLANYATITTIE